MVMVDIDITKIPLKDGDAFLIYSKEHLWKFHRSSGFIRFLDKYESDFVNSTIKEIKKVYNELSTKT